VYTPTLGEPASAQRFHLVHETEGAGTRDLTRETIRVHAEGAELPPDQGMREIDRVRDAEIGGRCDDVLCLALAHGEGLGNGDTTHRRVLLFDPAATEQFQERPGRPVRRRWLRSIHLDNEVIAAGAGGGGEQML